MEPGHSGYGIMQISLWNLDGAHERAAAAPVPQRGRRDPGRAKCAFSKT